MEWSKTNVVYEGYMICWMPVIRVHDYIKWYLPNRHKRLYIFLSKLVFINLNKIHLWNTVWNPTYSKYTLYVASKTILKLVEIN